MGSAPPLRGYTRLQVWRKGIELARGVYALTHDFPAGERYGLASQMRRAAVSVPSNIAEGHARSRPAEFRRFLRMALGSLAELDTQLTIAGELKMAEPDDVEHLRRPIAELQMMIGALIPSVGS